MESIISLRDKIKNRKEDILCSLACAYFISSVINIFIINTRAGESIDFVRGIIPAVEILILLSVFILCMVLCTFEKLKKSVYYLLLVSVVLFGILTIADNDKNIYLAMGVVAVICFFIYYLINNDKIFTSLINVDNKLCFSIVAIAFLIALVYFSVQTINRYRIFGASCFDFGIFAQMYENMAKTGMPLTTCERNRLLSHFRIHFSPIFYVALPIYYIVRSQCTLLFIQALFTFGGVFPLFMIGKKYKLPNIILIPLCLAFLLCPIMVSPLFYDFHENKFIPFFILWFIYFFDSEKYKRAYLFLILTIMIKEDTFIYIFFLLLYFIIVEKRYKHGLISMAIIALYAIPVITFMNAQGEGFIKMRYGIYFLQEQNSILSMVLNVFNNPAFVVKNIFSGDTFAYLVYAMGSLVFLPLVNRDYKRLILVLPFILINMMTTYGYQHDIGFQYNYGTGSILFYATAVNISQMSEKNMKIAVSCMLCASALLMYNHLNNRLISYTQEYSRNKADYEEMEKALAAIPRNASVTSEGFRLSHITDIDELYNFPYNEGETDYVVLEANTSSEEQLEFKNSYRNRGYEIVYNGSRMSIYKKVGAPEYGM